jgi:dienelactone hydrolase
MLTKWIQIGLSLLLMSFGVAVSAAPDTNLQTPPAFAGQKTGFLSSNPITFQQLLSQQAIAPQPVWAYLSMPKIIGKQKVAAVIMMPGAGGLTPWYAKYVKSLNDQGIATFAVDSFTPRGMGGIADNQAALPIPMLVADAYSALKYLGKEPNIDPHKIAIMGWSLGGLVSITTAFADLNQSVLNNKIHFAAHIAFYPPCNLIYPNDRLDGSPWLYLHGGADDYTQPADCLNLLASLRNSAVINAVLYPGASHAFDNPRPVEWLPDVQNPKNCHGVIAKDWTVTEQTSGAAINTAADYQKAYSGCMLRGAHLGFNKLASTDAMWQVNRFLQHYLLDANATNEEAN